jgi:hypothetical protein
MILADEDLPLAVVHDAGALSELAAGDHMSEAAADDDFDDIDYEDTGSMGVATSFGG